jgi:signal transduction histidine kinase/HAMP domain-containing protein
MATSVKNKIRLGTLFLFLLLLLSGGVGIFNLVSLKHDAISILRNNYESLDYCHVMQQQLDSFHVNAAASIQRFEQALRRQEANITEPGEKIVTQELRNNFTKLKSGDSSLALVSGIRQQLQYVLKLNMEAIQKKSVLTERRANQALTYISLIAAVVFLIALTFSFNFPSVIANPIHDLTEGIQEISQKNYQHRIHINSKDEFGKMAAAFNAMAERLEYFENSNLNKLMFEKARAEAVINSLKDASIGIDKNNIVLFANSQALQLLNLQASDIVGKKADDVAKRNDLFRFLLTDKSTTPFKIVLNNKENYFIREIIDVPQEQAKSIVIVVKNVTTFKELDVAKTNFIATVSHELKTPLASSDFSLKLLGDERTGKLNSDQKELVGQLKQDNQRMLRILSELLTMSQMETGKIHLDISPVSAREIADNALAATSTAAKEKAISIKLQIAENLPAVLADKEKAGWVLVNFLSNAIKYAPRESKVDVDITNENGQVVFSVRDQGAGIEKQYQEKVFERFFKVPGTKTNGTGLGLSISKEFIEAMSGKISVQSEPGMGSTFTFSLPAG